jgi:hypothetical protein
MAKKNIMGVREALIQEGVEKGIQKGEEKKSHFFVKNLLVHYHFSRLRNCLFSRGKPGFCPESKKGTEPINLSGFVLIFSRPLRRSFVVCSLWGQQGVSLFDLYLESYYKFTYLLPSPWHLKTTCTLFRGWPGQDLLKSLSFHFPHSLRKIDLFF